MSLVCVMRTPSEFEGTDDFGAAQEQSANSGKSVSEMRSVAVPGHNNSRRGEDVPIFQPIFVAEIAAPGDGRTPKTICRHVLINFMRFDCSLFIPKLRCL